MIRTITAGSGGDPRCDIRAVVFGKDRSRRRETGWRTPDFMRPGVRAPPGPTIASCRPSRHRPARPFCHADPAAGPAASPRPSPVRSPECLMASRPACAVCSWTMTCAAAFSGVPSGLRFVEACSRSGTCAGIRPSMRCVGWANWKSPRVLEQSRRIRRPRPLCPPSCFKKNGVPMGAIGTPRAIDFSDPGSSPRRISWG